MTANIPSILRTGDLLGIINSVLCLIHCMALPVLIAIGASFVQHPTVTWSFICLAFLAVRNAVRASGDASIALLLGIGWAVFAAGMVAEPFAAELEALTYLGSTLLIVGHLLNYRACRALRREP